MAKMLYLAGLLGAAATLRSTSLMHGNGFQNMMTRNKLAVMQTVGQFLPPKEMVKWVALFMRTNPNYTGQGTLRDEEHQGNVLNDLQGFNDAQAQEFPLEAMVMTLLGPNDFAAGGAFESRRRFVNERLDRQDLWHGGRFLRVMNLGGLFHGVPLGELASYLSVFRERYVLLKNVARSSDGSDGEDEQDPTEKENAIALLDQIKSSSLLIMVLIGELRKADALATKPVLRFLPEWDWTPGEMESVTKTSDGFRMAPADGYGMGLFPEEDFPDEFRNHDRTAYVVTFPEDRIEVIGVIEDRRYPGSRTGSDCVGSVIFTGNPAHHEVWLDSRLPIRKITIETVEDEFSEIHLQDDTGKDVHNYDVQYNGNYANTSFIKLLLLLRRIHLLFP